MDNNYDKEIIKKWIEFWEPAKSELDLFLGGNFYIAIPEIRCWREKKHKFWIVNIWRRITKTVVMEPVYKYKFKFKYDIPRN